MHGRGGEERKTARHMWTIPAPGNPIVNSAAGVSSSKSLSANYFFKDGRKIRIGDCAFFKPPEDCPPFIGIIRSLTVGEENKLELCVNWLYRPVEVKLGKGSLVEAEPNEIFYSFHKDNIPAASLLHPCKVAFLPKGVDLPSGTSSFVCRRVYDITNKCLWWLTDQNYIHDRQEEVDKLLYKTRVEMHATVQPGGRSPKPMSSPTSTSQLKTGSDGVPNSASSFPSLVKCKKRERIDPSSEPVKRERIAKAEDGDSGHLRHDSILKTDIARITEKGGLVNAEGVEKLVQLMVPDRNEKKIDLVSRSMLAAVIAATDKFDCLSRFVQLKGLPVLDEWLQEVHKRKIGDGGGSRGGDKSVEEFLLVLLRALDKLPVNLQALQTCNIGKSVNHLRTHKNSEIQKKARGLVDTWKRRVEAEITINDAKSGSGQTVSWSTKPRPPEAPQGGDRHSGGSSDVAMKSSVTQLSAPKTASVKAVQGENTSRSVSQGPMKSMLPSSSVAAKDGQLRGVAGGGGNFDVVMANARDEKSSSSGQSHNNGQSCSSNHAKAGGVSGKEDARSSTAMSVNKISGGSSRHGKSINGFPGSTSSGGQRETLSSRNSSMHKNSSSEKLSQSVLDGPSIDGNTHKLIVKIPNRGRSPAQSASGGSVDDPSIMNSRASSPSLSEKHDQCDHRSKEKSEFYRANTGSDIDTEYWQSNDFKDVLTGSVEGDGSPANTTDEERSRTADDAKKMSEVSKAASSASGNDNRTGNLQDVSFSSINALIESCVNYAEANASVSVVDDVGMNLLASVAAGEISKSELVTPAGSPERHNGIVEQSSEAADKVKPSDEDLVQDECHSNDDLEDEHKKVGSISHDVGSNNNDDDSSFLVSEGKAAAESHKHINTASIDLQQVTETCLERKVRVNGKPIASSLAAFPDSMTQEARDSDNAKQLKDNKCDGEVNAAGTLDVKVSDVSSEIVIGGIEKPSSHPSLEIDVKGDDCPTEGLSSSGQTALMPPAIVMQSDMVKRMDDKVSEDLNEREAKTDDIATHNHASQSEKQRNEQGRDAVKMLESRAVASSGSGVTCHASEYVEENSEAKEVHDQYAGQIMHRASPGIPSQEMDQHLGFRGSKLTVVEAEAEECTSTSADASPVSAAGVVDADAKIEFDLNEGFNADDGKCGEFSIVATTECVPTVRLISPVPFPASSVSSGIPASITVAAPAKGPFVPPEDLLKSKGELGWKGSAATSAFRPAEPRKVTEIPMRRPPIPAAAGSSRSPLDIDLNVPDERIIDDLASQSCARQTDCVSLGIVDHDPVCNRMMTSSPVRSCGGLGLDLNQADEISDVGNSTMSSNHKMDEPLHMVKSSSGVPPNGEMGVCRDFDLNDGPAVDDVGTEPSFFSQQVRSTLPTQPPIPGLRISNAELGNFSSWLPSAGNTYSAVTESSIMPNRDQPFSVVTPNGPQRMLGPTTGGSPFGSDAYRGPVLSSHAVPYPSAPYQYPPVFPFNSSFPLPSASFSGGSATYVDSTLGGRLCFPAVNSQLLGPAGTVSSHFPRPFVVSLTDNGNSSSAESNRKWARQGLDLNAGPVCPDIVGRDENSPLVPRQLSVASSQAVAEEQGRTFQLTSGILKRKEPDVGWDSYKQSSWQ